MDRPDHVRGVMASADFFNVLHTTPDLGRAFRNSECEQGHDGVVVVSRGFWQGRMASDTDAIGKTLTLSGRPYVVIGVMPDEFNLPLEADLWVPMVFTPEERVERRDQQLAVIGKLKPGVTAKQANAEMDSIARQLEKQYPRIRTGACFSNGVARCDERRNQPAFFDCVDVRRLVCAVVGVYQCGQPAGGTRHE